MSSSSTLNSALKNLPPESALLRIGTSPSSESHGVALFQVGPILGKIPVLLEQVLLSERLQSIDASKSLETASAGELELLTIPCLDADEPERIAIVRQWLETHSPTTTLVTFRNAAVLWSPGRVAVLAEPDQISLVCGAAVEFCLAESALRTIERDLETEWSSLKQNAALAFAYSEKALAKRSMLEQQFLTHLDRRTQLARLASTIQAPPLHPPTLRSQIAERLRERTRVVERWDLISDQLEVFERIYDLTAQRSADFVVARSGLQLEWVIVILLAVQILLSIVDLLSITTGT